MNVAGFRYESPLFLVRRIDAVKARSGADADYVVARDYAVSYLLDDCRIRTVVRAGLVTDLASVPRFARWAIDRVGPHLEASIVHDYLYVAWQDAVSAPAAEHRLLADRVFLAGMVEARVPWLQRTLIYWSVRLLGGPTYRRRDPVRYVEVPA